MRVTAAHEEGEEFRTRLLADEASRLGALVAWRGSQDSSMGKTIIEQGRERGERIGNLTGVGPPSFLPAGAA
jgi:hypothetical protein